MCALSILVPVSEHIFHWNIPSSHNQMGRGCWMYIHTHALALNVILVNTYNMFSQSSYLFRSKDKEWHFHFYECLVTQLWIEMKVMQEFVKGLQKFTHTWLPISGIWASFTFQKPISRFLLLNQDDQSRTLSSWFFSLSQKTKDILDFFE